MGVLTELADSKLNFFTRFLAYLDWDRNTWLLLMDLQPKEVIQLSNHTHLELDLHDFGEIMSKFILYRPEDDIISIYSSNYQLAIFPFDEECLISFSSCETMWD